MVSSNTRFRETDFDVFHIPGLEPRMDAIRQQLWPKFEAIGSEIADFLTDQIGQPFYVHIARHARRTVHAPDKTWMAWSANPRGYKPNPHFQIGINDQQLFIWFALFSEYKNKQTFSTELQNHFDEIWGNLPNEFYLSEDHTKEEKVQLATLSTADIQQRLERVAKVKKAEFLCGTVIHKTEAIQLTQDQMKEQIQQAFVHTQPLYELAR